MKVRALGFAAVEILLVSEAMASPLQRPATVAQASTDRMVAPPLDLVWSAPAGCPDGGAIKSEVLRLAGAGTRNSRHLKARASIRPDAETGWTLALATDLDGVPGERTLAGQSCQSLSDAATVMLALILNPEVVLPEGPAKVAPSTTASVSLSTAPKAGPSPVWLIGAHAGLQSGVLKDLSPSFALTLGAALGRASLRLVPGFAPPQDVWVDGKPGRGGRLWSASAAALGCWTALRGWAVLAPCLGVDVVRLQGRGLGVAKPQDSTVYWSSAELALTVAVPLGSTVNLALSGVGLLPFSRPSLYLDGIGTVNRPAAFAFRALAGIELAFR
jgi:hypothetical protein